ncbi:hypothetical protein HDE_10034 [Halotydeus destructor]|nr:hypothetical protein HDE_10034 [Halotydeus destructor]
MAKGNAGPEKVTLLWHLSTIVGTVFSISFLNLSSKEPPTDLNLYQSLGCLILFHLFGLISMKFYATRLSKPSGSDKTKRQSSSCYILNCTLIDMGFLLASIFIFHTLITLLGASPVE